MSNSPIIRVEDITENFNNSFIQDGKKIAVGAS